MDFLGLELGPYGLLDSWKSYIYRRRIRDVYEALKFHWERNFINGILILWEDLFNGHSVYGRRFFFWRKIWSSYCHSERITFLKVGHLSGINSFHNICLLPIILL